jgi:ABC-type sugar transport system permease subunit
MSTATVAQPVTHRRKSLAWLTGEQGILRAFIFAAPFLTLFGYFLLYPIGYGFWVSLTMWKLPAQPQYIGLDTFGPRSRIRSSSSW